MDVLQLIANVAVLFMMMIPGLILKKCNMVPDGFGKGLSNLVLYIAQPVLIVCAYLDCSHSFSEVWHNILWVFVLSVVAHVVFAVVALLSFGRVEEGRQKMLRFATVFGNAAFMGIPLIEVICGAEAAIYASIYNVTFNLFLWTLGVYICTRKKGTDQDGDGDADLVDDMIGLRKSARSEISLQRVLLHPVTLASLIGFSCLVLSFNRHTATLGFLWDGMSMIKNLVAPLSMMVIGLRLADIEWKGAFSDASSYFFLFLRHLLLPVTVLAVMKLLVYFGIPLSMLVQDVVIILAATPAASSAVMFAEKYDCDVAFISRLVVESTILSIVTMPLLIELCHMF